MKAAPLIDLRAVNKHYGKLHALRDLDLQLAPGTIGLLGPNGAGKTTLLKIVLGLIKPQSGSAQVLGYDASRQGAILRSKIGYMPEGDTVIPELTAHQFTSLAAELCGINRTEAVARAHQVLHYVGLGEARYRKLYTFSTGMRQRVRLAQAIVANPTLLLLDEPTAGLDPQGREQILSLIADIPKRSGASVILSTHILPDVERTCDQVVVMASGAVLYSGELLPLIASVTNAYKVQCKGPADTLAALYQNAGLQVQQRPGALQVSAQGALSAHHLLRLATQAGIQIREISPVQKSLEQAFLTTLKNADHVQAESV